MPAGGGTSQTAVVRSVGGRTQTASLVTAAAAAATMLVLAPLLGLLPQAVLAAVVIVYSIGLIDPAEFVAIRKIRTMEFTWALAAFAGVLVFGTLQGIVVAIVLSLIGLSSQAANPKVYVIGRKRGADVLRPLSPEHPDDETFEGLLILRPEGRLFFANAQQVGDQIRALVAEHRPQRVGARHEPRPRHRIFGPADADGRRATHDRRRGYGLAGGGSTRTCWRASAPPLAGRLGRGAPAVQRARGHKEIYRADLGDPTMMAPMETPSRLDPAATRLNQFFGPAADAHPGLSGFSLLSQGREAFIVRLALADLAERSLDMQYFSWDGDTTGRIIVDRVMKAADRGVRVRLLVDDPYYKASDSVKAALDAHPNVEIRLFNPLTNRNWSVFDFIFDFRRVNRRMHNKLVVVDNAAAIVGGRNIGDIYYGVNTIANYRDLDVLAVGPVVRDLSAVFERFWNSSSTVPIAAIVDRAHGAADLDAILVRLREEIAAADYPYPIDQDLDELAAQGAELRDNLVWAHGRVIADDPEAIARGQESDDVVAFIRGRVAQLKEELLVESPYFVLPAGARATVKALHERNVRVRVLTNSLASNDMLPAHSGYAKTRRPLLENGMELYELRPDTDAFRPGWSLLSGRSPAALHTKAMAFDREAVFIGSFNLDPRSAVINTEAGLYIESPELAEKLTAYMATGVLPANSYRVLLDPNGEIVWETVKDGQQVRYRDEPEASFRRRFLAGLWKLLPIESQL